MWNVLFDYPKRELAVTLATSFRNSHVGELTQFLASTKRSSSREMEQEKGVKFSGHIEQTSWLESFLLGWLLRSGSSAASGSAWCGA